MDAPEALREFLSYAVANLIDHPQQASIAIGHNAAGASTFRIQLAQEDVKRVIGKHGHTISAIRSLLNVAAAKHGIKVSLKVGTAKEDDAEAEAEAASAATAASDESKPSPESAPAE